MTELFTHTFNQNSYCKNLIFFPDGKSILFNVLDTFTYVCIFDLRKKRIISQIFSPEFGYCQLALSDSGKYISAGYKDLSIWDLVTAKMKQQYKRRGSRITKMIFMSDNMIASSAENGKVEIRDLRSPKIQQIVKSKNTKIKSFAYQNEKQLLAIPEKNYINIFDIRMLKEAQSNVALQVFKGHRNKQNIKNCQFHPKYQNTIVSTSRGKSELARIEERSDAKEDQLIWFDLDMNIIKKYEGQPYRKILLFPNNDKIIYSTYFSVYMVSENKQLIQLDNIINNCNISSSGKQLGIAHYNQVSVYDIAKW